MGGGSEARSNAEDSRSAFDELSSPVGVRRFDSCPPHHQVCPSHFRTKIFKTLWEMKKEHYAELTIENTGRRLRYLAKFCDIDNPEQIEAFLANMKAKNSYIETIANAYNRYARIYGLKWNKPKIKRTSQPPYVPTSEEATVLIANAGTKYCLILSIYKDTGVRPIEMQRMKHNWIDFSKGNNAVINVETAKYGQGRSLQVKETTTAMLKEYLIKHGFKQNDNIFPTTKTMRRALIKIRKATAKKLQRPELERISLYSFRHYYASKLYHDTRDYFLVKRKLGHRRIEQTLTYIHLVYDDFNNSGYVATTAETVKEACKLIESGFEYVTEMDGVKLFKKRK